jgi:hypothetical protein
VSPPYCLVPSYTRPGARRDSTRSVSVGCQLMGLLVDGRVRSKLLRSAAACDRHGGPPRFRLHGPFQVDVRPLKCAPRRPFGFPGFHRRSNDRRSLIRNRRADPPGPDLPTSGLGESAPGEGVGSLLQPPSGRRSLGPVKWRLRAARDRALDRALPEIAAQSDQATATGQSPAPSSLAASQRHAPTSSSSSKQATALDQCTA